MKTLIFWLTAVAVGLAACRQRVIVGHEPAPLVIDTLDAAVASDVDAPQQDEQVEQQGENVDGADAEQDSNDDSIDTDSIDTEGVETDNAD